MRQGSAGSQSSTNSTNSRPQVYKKPRLKNRVESNGGRNLKLLLASTRPLQNIKKMYNVRYLRGVGDEILLLPTFILTSKVTAINRLARCGVVQAWVIPAVRGGSQ